MNWDSFKYFADENIAPELIEFLRLKGLDVISVIEEGLVGYSDSFLIEYSNRDNRIILTHDSDFGKIVFMQKVKFTGIIFLRPGHFNPEISIDSLKTIFIQTIEINVPFIIVAENSGITTKIRYRKL